MSSSMASISRVLVLMMMMIVLVDVAVVVVEGNWCVARSDASIKSLQTALDYACGAGADCTPIQTNGLCFLPNTIYAHASYAFNSYFQRRSMAPGSCDFSSTATVATTDPSYGSCVYPSSLRTAGGAATGTGTGGSSSGANNPYTVPAPPFVGGVGTPGTGTGTPSIPTDNSNSEATTTFMGFWFVFGVPATFTAFCLLLLV